MPVPPLFHRGMILGGLILVLALLPAMSLAQSDADSAPSDYPPAFQSGGWGLQFQVSELDASLLDFQGSLLSARYHVSETSAFRVGLTTNGSFEDEEIVDQENDSSPLVSENRSIQDYGVTGQYLRYHRPSDDIFVFVGAGPQVSYRTAEIERTRSDGQEVQQVDQNGYRVGAAGILGVEWFVHPNISLSAEYGFEVTYDRTVTEEDERLETTTSAFRFGGRSVLVGITFSFGP